MAIKTVVKWGTIKKDQNRLDKLELELNRLVSIGVTDGSCDADFGGVTRFWTTVEAAQGWIDFLNSFDQAPISAHVVQD